jgi:hypothetical protein
MAFQSVNNSRVQLLEFCSEAIAYAIDEETVTAVASVVQSLLRKVAKLLEKVCLAALHLAPGAPVCACCPCVPEPISAWFFRFFSL